MKGALEDIEDAAKRSAEYKYDITKYHKFRHGEKMSKDDEVIKEALEWVEDAFADIDESRVKLRRSDPILDRAERSLKTIREVLTKHKDRIDDMDR